MALGPIPSLRGGYAPVPAGPTPGFGDRMRSVANLFGMSTDELMGTLQQGKSLGDIAAERNIGRDAVLTAVKDELGVHPAAPPSRQIDVIANRIVDQRIPAPAAGTIAPADRAPSGSPRSRVDFRA